MSNFTRTTKHPITGKFEPAEWLDNFYGPHQYAVQFPNGYIFRADERKWEFEEATKELQG